MDRHNGSMRKAAWVAAITLIAPLAMALVSMRSEQTYEFNVSGDQTAYVCRYDFTADELNWHGPFYGPTDFDITFTRGTNQWIGLYTYNENMGVYERAYFLYYTHSL